ncbi:hypothetical protein EDD18DRAFT_1102303 [Armillaria luteobubalina]|uniref:Uncharacterized protein n=1 Tax=Armillaria luteobubalina TaxID=153913 RepID=A0AA39QEA8_9AGAR|nr:hypothetical protein EDD18DRAFT_1102303 [Armillaria luteobubalina]
MDCFYNKDNARCSIDALITNRICKDKYHLMRLVKGPGQDKNAISNAYIKKDDDVGTWRIVRHGNNKGAVEEIVFTITGAINMLDLPPITRETRNQKEKARFLSQTIRLTGLGSKGFEDAVNAIKVVQQMGEQEFKEGELEDWKPSVVQGYTIVELSNRYFRPHTASNEEESVPFSTDVDPEGILGRLMQHKLMHMDNNIVSYFKGEIDNRGKKRYTMAKPQIFRVGDIVEAQCSMVFLRSNNSAVRLKPVLRAIVLVNCDHSMKSTYIERFIKKQQASNNRKNATDQLGPTSVRMKRKIGFANDTDEDEYEGAKRTNEGRNDEDRMSS